MNFKLALTSVALAAATFSGAVSAAPIVTTFNFVPFGILSANTGLVTTATFMNGGGPYAVNNIFTDNTGLALFSPIGLPDPMPLTVGASFSKTFTTALGTFVETLIIDSRTAGASSLGITATGTITETVVLTGVLLDPSPVFFSAAYTQNGGPGAVINGSFNNSTTPPVRVPEPGTLSILGLALAGMGFMSRRRRA